MGLVQEQIKQQFMDFASRFGPGAVIPATVTAVNNDDTIAVLFSDDVIVEDVRLKSVVKDGNKFLLIPAVDSVVQVAKIENSDELVVIAVEEITEMKCIIENVEWRMDETGFLLQKGNDTLKKIFDDLFTAIQAITVPTNVGPSGIPLNQQSFIDLKTRADNIFK